MAVLQSLADGLSEKRVAKQYDKVLECIGRLKQKYALAAQYNVITVTTDDAFGKANAIQWICLEKLHSQVSHPGFYCLRTNQNDWDEVTL